MLLVIVVGQTVILSEWIEGRTDGGVWPTEKGMSHETGFKPVGQVKNEPTI